MKLDLHTISSGYHHETIRSHAEDIIDGPQDVHYGNFEG
jgi:hypothetical protein